VTSDGVIITDVAGRIWLVNGPAEHITGWTAAEAAGQPLGSVFKTVYEEAAGPDRITLVRRDGTRRAIPGGSAVPLRDDTGAPIGAVLCFHAARPALSRVLELMRPVQIVAESA
jgi:PAS domain S-box-containing protein